jgi:acyl dehydratase
MSESFDRSTHRLVPSRGFEELALGERFCLPSRTVTAAHFAAFQTLSGDNHPIHYDVEYCRERGHPELLAHGLQVLAYLAAGAGLFPHVIGDALLGFIEQSAHFLKPVYAGDTLYPALEITALTPQRSTGIVTMRASLHNQRGELVLSGEHKYLLRLRRPDAR